MVLSRQPGCAKSPPPHPTRCLRGAQKESRVVHVQPLPFLYGVLSQVLCQLCSNRSRLGHHHQTTSTNIQPVRLHDAKCSGLLLCKVQKVRWMPEHMFQPAAEAAAAAAAAGAVAGPHQLPPHRAVTVLLLSPSLTIFGALIAPGSEVGFRQYLTRPATLAGPLGP